MTQVDECVLVMEMGGTTTRAARYDTRTGQLGRVETVRTPQADGSENLEAMLTTVVALAADVTAGRSPDRVGLAFAGPLDASGRVLAAPTIVRGSFTGDVDLAAECTRRWPGAISLVVNDLTAAGLAYVADGVRDFAVLTIGSGIGHKVFLDARPRVGAGRGGEIGHLRVDRADDALLCDCGARGHLGGLSSGRGTTAMVRRQAQAHPELYASSVLGHLSPSDLVGEHVADAYRSGDPFTCAAVAAPQEYLGQALAAIHLDTGVERFVITGGFAHGMGHVYVSEVAAAAARSCWDTGQDWQRMVQLDTFGEHIGLIGLGRTLTSSPRGTC